MIMRHIYAALQALIRLHLPHSHERPQWLHRVHALHQANYAQVCAFISQASCMPAAVLVPAQTLLQGAPQNCMP